MDGMIIYKATNKLNGMVYIGQTCRSLPERMAEHQRKHDTYFDKALRKYSPEAFNVEQIDSANSIEELNRKESYWIKYFNCIAPNGYNLCEGGGNTKGFHHREESKKKMSKSKSANYVGADNPFFGKTHSEQSKQRMSAARKGMAHLTDEQICNLRKFHFHASVVNVDTGEVFDSVNEAAEHYGLKATHITRVCKGGRKKTGGFVWRYA